MRPALLRWIDAHHPAAVATLRPPASEEALQEAKLPPAFAALYAAHDGQEEGSAASTLFDEGMVWLPLAYAAKQRAMFTKVLEEVRDEFPEQEPFAPSWLPFAGDLSGNVMVVDVERDEVFYFDHAEGRAEGDAPTSAEFLDALLADLTSGARVVAPELGVIDPRSPPRRHRPPR